MTKNGGDIKSKAAFSALYSTLLYSVYFLEDSNNHKRKVRWDCLSQVQEVISSKDDETLHRSSSSTMSASCAHTTSIRQHQVASEEWKEGESTGSNKPCCIEPQAHQMHQQHSQTSGCICESTSTTSSELRTQAVTPLMKHSQSL